MNDFFFSKTLSKFSYFKCVSISALLLLLVDVNRWSYCIELSYIWQGEDLDPKAGL